MNYATYLVFLGVCVFTLFVGVYFLRMSMDLLDQGRGQDANSSSQTHLISKISEDILDRLIEQRQQLLIQMCSFEAKLPLSGETTRSFNIQAADYITWSQFILLPHLETLGARVLHAFNENSVAFSYLTNVLHQYPSSKQALSLVMEKLAERFVLEDNYLGVNDETG